MKIITIPMDKQELESGVSSSFGRAPYFLFYNTVTNESKWMANSAADNSGGAGVSAAQFLADNGTNALITPRCGENAKKVLNGANIKVYRSIEGTAKENINAFAEVKLSPLAEFHAGLHGHDK